MSDWELKIVRAEVERLLPLAAEDASLRDRLRAVARSILDATDAPAVADPPATAPEPLLPLTLGQPRPPSPPELPRVTGARGADATDEDLAEIEAACRSKAIAAGLAAERLRQEHEGLAPDPGLPQRDDPGSTDWASGLVERLQWSVAGRGEAGADPARIDDVAGNYEALADAIAAARAALARAPANPKGLDRVLPLVAEAQAALRAAVAAIGAAEEHEQLRAFAWLKETAARRRVYLRRFMRADDLPDPAAWGDRLSRIERELERHGPALTAAQQAALKALEHSAAAIAGAGERDQADLWSSLFGAIGAALDAGLPPSARELREPLLPLVETLPDRDTVPPAVDRVLREIDRYLASRPEATPEGREEPSHEVREAGRLLAGRSVLLIGGRRRRPAQEALRAALGLKELIWLATKEHQPVASFEPMVSRPDVAVVLLAIRWASHAFTDVKPLCDRHGKPLVRLPGGYGTNQVAAQILGQCGDRLGRRPD